jgi:hypothetical protein
MHCNAVTKREHWVNDPSRVREWIISNQRSFQSRDSWSKVEGHHRHGGTMRNKSSTSQVQVKYEEETWLQGDLSTTSPSYIAVREVGCQTHEFDHGLHTAFARHLENDHPVFGFADQSVHIAKFLLYSFYYLYRKTSPVLLLLRTLELSYLYGMVEALQIVASSRKKVTTSPPYHFSVSKRIFENPWLTLFGSRRCIVLSIYRLEVELDSIACHCVRGCPGIAYQRSCMPFCCGNGLPYYRTTVLPVDSSKPAIDHCRTWSLLMAQKGYLISTVFLRYSEV